MRFVNCCLVAMSLLLETFSTVYILVSSLVILTIYILYSHNSKTRRLRYYGSKFPGPLALPLIRNFHLLFQDYRDAYKVLYKFCEQYFPICRFWLDTLYVSSSQPHHVEAVLNKCMDKGQLYEFMADDYFRDTALFAPIPLWKRQRKMLDLLLKPNIVNTFLSIFSREAKLLTNSLEEGKPVDLFLKMWHFGTSAACETIGGVNPRVMEGKKQSILDVLRYEEIMLKRFVNPLLHVNFLWKLSSSKKEVKVISERAKAFGQKMVDENRSLTQQTKNSQEKSSLKDRLLTHLVDSNKENQFSQDLLLRIAASLLPLSSETTAIGLSSTILLLGMYPEIQEKVYEELFSIFGDSERDPTLEDVSSMVYLERVIKESLRILPPVPLILRTIDQDITLDSHVLPKGSVFFVMIQLLHRNPDIWPKPLEFDPDRFLPEETRKRHRCAYIPFSTGSRNCPGSKYAMLSMKVTISTVLRRYTVKTLDYAKVEDIELFFALVGKASKGYRIILEKRNGTK